MLITPVVLCKTAIVTAGGPNGNRKGLIRQQGALTPAVSQSEIVT